MDNSINTFFCFSTLKILLNRKRDDLLVYFPRFYKEMDKELRGR